MVILLEPLLLEELMVLIPGIPLIDFSSGSVIWLSMISALAPAYEVRTFTIGGSIAGYSRTDKKLYPTTPNKMMSKFITVASMGLLRASSEIFIISLALQFHLIILHFSLSLANLVLQIALR